MIPVHLSQIKVYPFQSRNQLLDFIKDKQALLIAVNAEKIMGRNKVLNRIINENIGYSDGIGAVLALRKKGCYDTVKIPGCELWLDIIKRFEKEKTFYLVGAEENVIQAAIVKLKKEFQAINILNFRNGFFSEKEKNVLIEDVCRRKPDVVFVAQGTPRQEYLMEEMLKRHPALYMGLGGSFDVYTGNVKRAPDLFIKLGLEWLYRLLLQPLRFKRQIVFFEFLIQYASNRL